MVSILSVGGYFVRANGGCQTPCSVISACAVAETALASTPPRGHVAATSADSAGVPVTTPELSVWRKAVGSRTDSPELSVWHEAVWSRTDLVSGRPSMRTAHRGAPSFCFVSAPARRSSWLFPLQSPALIQATVPRPIKKIMPRSSSVANPRFVPRKNERALWRVGL